MAQILPFNVYMHENDAKRTNMSNYHFYTLLHIMYVTHTFDYHVLITHCVCILNYYGIVYRFIFMLGMYEFENPCFKHFYQSVLCKMYYNLVIEIMSTLYSTRVGKFGPCD